MCQKQLNTCLVLVKSQLKLGTVLPTKPYQQPKLLPKKKHSLMNLFKATKSRNSHSYLQPSKPKGLLFRKL